MKITMFYDGSCPICRTEAYHLRDEHSDKIAIVTVDEGMDRLAKAGISRIDAMTYLCVQDVDGTMIKGIDAVRLLHKTADSKFATVLSLPVAKQLAGLIYPIFARNRYYLPDWFTRLLFGKVAEEDNIAGASNANDNNDNVGNACEIGVCKIPPAKR